jgi:hypothetical protein
MQTYAVVDCDFKFVKIGRTGDLDSRLSTLNTASPKPLLLMALANEDIEQSMHRMLDEHRERLEWFRYNEHTESAIITRMTPTKAWFKARKEIRRHQKETGDPNRMPAVDMTKFSRSQRDHIAGLSNVETLRLPPATGVDPLGELFGLPNEAKIAAVVARGQKCELLEMRRTLSACGQRARAECAAANGAPLSLRATQAAFALEIVKNWKRRVGMELGALHRPQDLNISPDSTPQ